MRFLIDFSYSGKWFKGYQKQKNLRTVQAELEKVLTMINDGKYVKVISSGRTDAKVNALHQIAHFDLDLKVTAYKLKGALNSYLPEDIYINNVKIISSDFHARYLVKKKTYQYKINVGRYNPLENGFIYQYGKSLDLKQMKKCIKQFVGTYDFTTFASSDDRNENKVRTIYAADVKKENDIITISFTGSGFLKYQVRNMVGLLIKCGKEGKNIDVIDLINKKDRTKIGITAPANGLTLVEVCY